MGAASPPITHPIPLNEVQVRSLLELAPDAIFVADIDGRYTYVNDAACRLLGYERAELVGKTILDLIPAADVERLARSKAQMLRGCSDVSEWTLLRKDGGWVPVEVHANILPDGQWQGFVRDISERKALEAERQVLFEEIDSERRWLQALVDTVPAGVMFLGADGSLRFNQRAQGLLGMPPASHGGIQQFAGRIFRPDGTPLARSEFISRRALEEGETHIAVEQLLRSADGTMVPVLSSAGPIRDARGAIRGAVAIFIDISKRVRAEEAVRENERLLSSIFEILPVGIWVADKEGRIVRNNPAGEAIWRGARYVGVSEFGQYKGWWADSGKPIAAEEWALARALLQGATSTGELIRIQCFDGSFKTILNSAAPLRGKGGELTGAIVVNQDVSALHAAEEKARQAERLFRTALDLLPIGLWIADHEGNIQYGNPAGQRIWAGARYVGPEQYGEYKAWWVESGEPIAPEDWAVARAVRHGETAIGELIRIQCFDGSFRTVLNSAAPIRSEAGQITGAVAINEDVTALHQTQEQLQAAVRDREEILAVVSHDLRNPLGGLMMSASAAERLAAGLPGGEPVRAIAASLSDMARRMSGLVDDLLAVAVARTSGRSMLNTARIDAALLLEKAAAQARPLFAAAAVRLDVCPVGVLPRIHVDVDRILRVFGNLLDNALKFTDRPGTVELRAEAVSAGVRYCVANSGPPLSSAELERMFQPFWQASRDRRGAGLGLSICRSIVEAHGGSIWAEPVAGRRVRVCFVLPRGKPASRPLKSGPRG